MRADYTMCWSEPLPKSMFPDTSAYPNNKALNKLYERLIYFEHDNVVSTATDKINIVPYWKILGDENTNSYTNNAKTTYYYINQWFSNWYRSEIKYDAVHTFYTAEPVVFWEASLESKPGAGGGVENTLRAEYYAELNNFWLKKTAGDKYKFATVDPKSIKKIEDIAEDKRYVGHEKFAWYSQHSKDLKSVGGKSSVVKNKNVIKLDEVYDKIPTTNLNTSSIIDYTKSGTYPYLAETVSTATPNKFEINMHDPAKKTSSIVLDVLNKVMDKKFNSNYGPARDVGKLYNILYAYPKNSSFIEASSADALYGIQLDINTLLKTAIVSRTGATTNVSRIIQETQTLASAGGNYETYYGYGTNRNDNTPIKTYNFLGIAMTYKHATITAAKPIQTVENAVVATSGTAKTLAVSSGTPGVKLKPVDLKTPMNALIQANTDFIKAFDPTTIKFPTDISKIFDQKSSLQLASRKPIIENIIKKQRNLYKAFLVLADNINHKSFNLDNKLPPHTKIDTIAIQKYIDIAVVINTVEYNKPSADSEKHTFLTDKLVEIINNIEDKPYEE